MSKIWNNFSKLYGGNFVAREVFEELCYEFLDTHYPGKAVVAVNDIEKSKPENLNVIFVSKFFTDELTNSRRGQIRKAFNDFLLYKEKNKLKVYNWVFCVSYTLNNDELMWWLNWKEKMVHKHGVNIEIFDGDIIVERVKKYGLYEKWFVVNKKEESEKAEKEKVAFELIPDEKQVIFDEKQVIPEEKQVILEEKQVNKKILKINEKLKNRREKVKKKQELEKKIIEASDEKNLKEDKQNIEKKIIKESHGNSKKEKIKKKIEKAEIKHNIKPASKMVSKPPLPRFTELKLQFVRAKVFANKLSKKEKTDLKEISSLKKWDKLFEVKDNLNISTLKLFYKAKSFEIRKKYIHAVFVYEEILKKKDYKDVLKFKIEELYNALEKCQNNSQAILNEFEGDIYFIRKNYIKAIEYYESSYNLNKNNKTYAKKYYETLGDSQIENDLPAKAVISYAEALNNDKINEILEQKLQNAKYLSSGKKHFKSSPFSLLNVFVSPFAYWSAYSIEKKESTKEKLNNSTKKFAYVVSFMLILLVVFIFVFNKNVTLKNIKVNKKEVFVQSENFVKPISLDQVAVDYGDKIMSNISYEKIHLVDTAIAAYKRAIAYNSNNEIAYEQLKKAVDYKKEYLSSAQANILLDSTAYFISMRRSSENLQLFKYLFNPNDKTSGKYGFVDTNMQIVIPPVYDFNYNIMYKGNENFINGEAFICLVHSKGDTNYYKIDRNNNFKLRL